MVGGWCSIGNSRLSIFLGGRRTATTRVLRRPTDGVAKFSGVLLASVTRGEVGKGGGGWGLLNNRGPVMVAAGSCIFQFSTYSVSKGSRKRTDFFSFIQTI